MESDLPLPAPHTQDTTNLLTRTATVLKPDDTASNKQAVHSPDMSLSPAEKIQTTQQPPQYPSASAEPKCFTTAT
jgi:hypothetical protein